MSYVPYVGKGLNNFEDTIDAFIHFNKGGYWVKKIDKKEGVLREIVSGPFKKVIAQKIASNWDPDFDLPIKKYAKVYSFSELSCSNIKEHSAYLEDIYIWKPPKGIDIFCISNKLLDVCVYDKSLLSNNDFIKFYKYGQINDVKYILQETNKFNAPIVPKIICYYSKDIKAYKKAQKIAKYLNEEIMHTEKNKNYVINKILDKHVDENDRPIIFPSHITNDVVCDVIDLYFFKNFYKEKNAFRKAFDELKKCLDNESIIFQNLENNYIEIVIEIDLIVNSKDYKPKKLYLKHSESQGLKLELGDHQDSYSVKLKDSIIDVNLPKNRKQWNIFLMEKMGDDKDFYNVEKIIALFLYICKCLGKTNLTIKDQRTIDCACDSNESQIYINIIRELANLPSIYESVGFVRKNNKTFQNIVQNYKDVKLSDLIQENIKYDEKRQLFLEKTVGELATMYMNGMCAYDEMCNILSVTSTIIHNKITNCCLEYSINLDKISLSFLRKFF